jgi:hypothetical protein
MYLVLYSQVSRAHIEWQLLIQVMQWHSAIHEMVNMRMAKRQAESDAMESPQEGCVIL